MFPIGIVYEKTSPFLHRHAWTFGSFKGLQEKRVLYTLPYRKYLMACVLTVFPFFYWRVLMAYVFSDFSGMGKCKISGKTNIDTWYRSFAELLEHSIIHT